MANRIQVDSMSTIIGRDFKIYSKEITDGMKKVNDECMKEFVSDTKRDAPKSNSSRSGTFASNITSKTKSDKPFRKINVWYVRDPEYRLTHLLKNGHATRDGGRTKAQDFISYNYEKLENKFEEGIKEVIERGY